MPKVINQEELNKAIDYSQYAADLPEDDSADDEGSDYSFWGEKDPRKPGTPAPAEQEAPKAAVKGVEPSSKRTDPLSDDEISKLKELAPLWLRNIDIQRKHNADPRKNPILSAEGRKHADLHEAMKDYHSSFDKKAKSEDYQNGTMFDKWRAQHQHKQDWHKENPDHHSGIMDRIDDTRKVYDVANRAHLHDKKEMLQDALTPGKGTMSSTEAAQHFGTKEGGEDEMPTVSTVRSATSSFGAHNPQLIRQELDNLKDLQPLSPEDEEILQDKGSKAPMVQHPAFNDPENKKLVNDFYSLHGKAMRDDHIKKLMNGLGIDEGLHQHIDMGKLADSAMTGMLRGVKDYDSNKGKSLGQYVHYTANNHVRSELQRQHQIAQSLRNKAKQSKATTPAAAVTAPDAKPAAPVKVFSPEEKAALQAKYAAQGKTVVKPKADPLASMPSDMKERHQSILAAKKTQTPGEE